MQRLGTFVGILFVVFTGLPGVRAQLARVPNTTLQMPQNPATRPYVLQQQFGRSFSAPVALVTPPGETNRLFIVEKIGRISLITNLTAATPTVLTFLNITNKVNPDGEQGLLGLAFHPDYKDNGYFYIFYVTPGTRYDRLSRYTVSATDPNAADPTSEVILINQFDDYSNHNGGDLHFGPDGYLYVALGDEGDGGDTGRNSQRIDKDFFAGILRIDVDKRPGNLPANAHAAATTNYFVPADNPFVGATSFNGVALANPSRVRTEFWATGLRNPWRMSFDRDTGTLWCGDVGQGAREEIDIIVKGGNYGWNYREGTIRYTGTPPPGFVGIEPVYDYPRSAGVSVTGGLVYRGSRISQLYGAYLFADYGSGNFWALRLNESGKGVVQLLLTDVGIVAFGTDPSNGDVLVCDITDGRIRRLVYSTQSVGIPIPPTLAETGAFSDLASLTPEAGIVPYDLNLPFWSDGATKTRWFSIPDATNTFTFNATNTWLTPTGVVWIKHFDMQMTNGDAASKRRLETRFIVRNTNGIYGVTYRWTNETDAVLVPEGGFDEPLVITDGGTTRTQVWHYPSRSECLACHTSAAGWVLGWNTAQLNRDFTHTSVTTNQITALANAGYLSNAPEAPQAYHALAKPDDTTVSQEFRVRSYLFANCANCHRPGGPALANFDARISTPTDDANLINGALINSMGDPANRTLVPNLPEHSMILQRMSIRGPGQMPPIASNVPDEAGIDLLRSFITGDLTNRQTFSDWQVAKFNEPLPPEAAAESDPDNDGAVNFAEFLANTNPTLSTDFWAIHATISGGQIVLSYDIPQNRAVIIESADSIPPTWTPVDHPDNRLAFPVGGDSRAISDQISDNQMRIYRARLISP
jgi:glucose/arabinose dehydrogenase/mono/diheme cytochrome c family protein